MFTYFILMLTSTICGAFLSLIISSSIFIKKSEERTIEIPHRLGIRLTVLEHEVKELFKKLEDQDNFVENTEKFCMDKLEQELEQIRLDLNQEISDLKIKLDALGASSDTNDLIEEVISEIRDRL